MGFFNLLQRIFESIETKPSGKIRFLELSRNVSGSYSRKIPRTFYLKGKRGKRVYTKKEIKEKYGMRDAKGRKVKFWFLVTSDSNDMDEYDAYVPYYSTNKKGISITDPRSSKKV